MLLCFLFVITGCEARNTSRPVGKLVKENNVSYVLTCLQNQPFISTQDSDGGWTFSGPLDGPCK